MKVETLEFAGLFPALEALRLPYKLEPRSKQELYRDLYKEEGCEVTDYDDYAFTLLSPGSTIYLHKKDLSLIKSLIKKGDEHAKICRGIEVWAKIEMPLYFMVEFDTYIIGVDTLATSSSMHVDCKGLQGEELQKAKGDIRGDYMYTRIFKANYQALRRIYQQRCVVKHRLPEWEIFGKWIQSLPLAEQLILI